MKVRTLRWRFYRKRGGPYRTIGLRCSDYCRGCICCDGWMFYYTRGRFARSFDEIREAYPDSPEDVYGSWAEVLKNGGVK